MERYTVCATTRFSSALGCSVPVFRWIRDPKGDFIKWDDVVDNLVLLNNECEALSEQIAKLLEKLRKAGINE